MKSNISKIVFLSLSILLMTIVLIGYNEVDAFPAMSPDGTTCTPCHEEGFTGEHKDTPSTGGGVISQKLHPVFDLATKGLYISRDKDWDSLWETTPNMPVFSYPEGSSPWDNAWK